MTMRLCTLLLAGLGLTLGLSACEDPSNVGLGLVGGEGGDPVVIDLPTEAFENQPVDDPNTDTSFVLAGTVADPLLADLRATGYVDFAAASLPDAFEAGPVTRATLFLVPGYVYGDTEGTVTLQLRSMPNEWTGNGTRSDTTLADSGLVTEFTFSASDTLVRVPLPAEWVSANDAVLRGTAFAANFHGFQVAPVSGNAVVGFKRTESFLRAYSAADSVTFLASRTLGTVARTGALATPPGRLVLQDGVGPWVRLTFDLTRPEVGLSSLNRAVIRVHADTLWRQTGTFVRPLPRQLDLYFVDDEGIEFQVERATVDSAGTYTFRSDRLLAPLQAVLLGNLDIEQFELRVPRGFNTFNTAFFFDAASAERRPQALLTVTPIEN